MRHRKVSKIVSQKRSFLERQMIPGSTNVGITPTQIATLFAFNSA